MKKVLLTFAILFSFTALFAQINKGQYMVGGSGSFKYDNAGSGNTLIQQTLNITPNVGYFLFDKLAVGLDVSLTSNKVKTSGTVHYKSFGYTVSPFVRYYVLPTTNKFNVFAEGSYGWGASKTKYIPGVETYKNNSSGYSFSAGPVFFVTPNVGIELSVGYSGVSNKSDQPQSTKATYKGIQTGLGLQIHLGKGKK